jgi:hypothetical protein
MKKFIAFLFTIKQAAFYATVQVSDTTDSVLRTKTFIFFF